MQFDWLLSNVDAWHADGFSHRPKSVQRRLANYSREKINEKIDLAKQRETKRLIKLQKVDIQ